MAFLQFQLLNESLARVKRRNRVIKSPYITVVIIYLLCDSNIMRVKLKSQVKRTEIFIFDEVVYL